MSFLDNLENSLKNLEGKEERDSSGERKQRTADRARAAAEAPWAEQLKTSTFTSELLNHTVNIGHGTRTKINMAWLGNTLRLQARDRQLELQPTPDGVAAVFIEGGEETSREIIDLHGSPEALAQRWLK